MSDSVKQLKPAPGEIPFPYDGPTSFVEGHHATFSLSTHNPIYYTLSFTGFQNNVRPAIIVLEYFDPVKNAIVRGYYPTMSGFQPTNITILTGSFGHSISEVKISFYNIAEMDTGVLGHLLGTVNPLIGAVDDAIGLVASVGANIALTVTELSSGEQLLMKLRNLIILQIKIPL